MIWAGQASSGLGLAVSYLPGATPRQSTRLLHAQGRKWVVGGLHDSSPVAVRRVDTPYGHQSSQHGQRALGRDVLRRGVWTEEIFAPIGAPAQTFPALRKLAWLSGAYMTQT